MTRKLDGVFARVAAILLAICCCLTGCHSSGRLDVDDSRKADAEKTTLSLFGFMTGKDRIEEIDQSLSTFMRENENVAVSYEGLSTNDGYASTLDKRLETGNADDLFMVNPQVLRTYADKGYFDAYFVDLANSPQLTSAYSDEVLAMVTYGGVIPALPMSIGSFGMYVNEDLLEEHGIDRSPSTLGEFLDDCARLKADGVTPIAASSNGEGFTAKVLALGRSFACDPGLFNLQSGGVGEISRTELAKAMRPGCELVEELTRQVYWDVEAAKSAKPAEGDVAAFAEGSYAFLPSASWASSALQQADPDFEWEFIGLPVADDGRIAMIRPIACVAVNSAGESQEESLGLMRFLANEEAVLAFTRGQEGISPLKNGKVENEFVVNMSDLMAEGRAYCDCNPRYSFDLYTSIGPEVASIMDGSQGVSEAVERLAEVPPSE